MNWSKKQQRERLYWSRRRDAARFRRKLPLLPPPWDEIGSMGRALPHRPLLCGNAGEIGSLGRALLPMRSLLATLG
jgi:hypothetical protein